MPPQMPSKWDRFGGCPTCVPYHLFMEVGHSSLNMVRVSRPTSWPGGRCPGGTRRAPLSGGASCMRKIVPVPLPQTSQLSCIYGLVNEDNLRLSYPTLTGEPHKYIVEAVPVTRFDAHP